MRKIVLFGMALAMSGAVMGQTSAWSKTAKADDENEVVLDSIVTKTNEGKDNAKTIYGYDTPKLKSYQISISYSAWTQPAYAPQYGDSTSYEYNDKGLLIKESVYSNSSNSGAPVYNNMRSYIEYEYNEKGQLVKSTTYRYNDNVEAYVDNSIYEYKYADDGSLITRIDSNRPGGAPWETDIKDMQISSKVEYSDFVGIDLPKKSESYFYTAGTDGAEGTWGLSSYSVMTYDEKNQLVKDEFYMKSGDSWKVSSYEVYTYNEMGLVATEEVYREDYETKELKLDDKTAYAYNENGKLKTITGETWQQYKNAWVAKNPITYWYSAFKPTSIRRTEVAQGVEVVYNAAAREISVQAESAISSITVYSLNGLKMISVQGGNSQESVNVSGWEKGVYIVTLVVDGKTYSKKVSIYE